MDFDRVLTAAGVVPTAVEPLGYGTYNTAYRIRVAGDDDLVLKIAPDPGRPTMGYEHDIMRTEALFYRKAVAAIPVPRIVHADFSRQVIDSDFLVMTALPGENWHAQRARLDDTPLRHQLGGLVAALHRITGPGFGYPQDKPATTWRAAFTAMFDMLLADAARFAAPLPWPLDRIRDVTSRHTDALDEVRTPVLVHFDLWAGNILVDDSRITGIVDGERAFWGDPLAEMVSLALLGDIEQDAAFLSGYRSAGGHITFDTPARRRLALYRCYLYLIMLVEIIPRGYSDTDRDALAELVNPHLVTALLALGVVGA